MALSDVLLDELRDLYSAENQLVKALPKLAKAAEDEELKQSFTDHLEETKGHVERLKQIFTILEEKPTGKHCNGMEGLIEEGKEAIDEEEEAEAYDIGLIGAAGRVEHYEIAGYTAVIAIARGLGKDDIVELLEQTLSEEDAAREKLEAKIAELIEATASTDDSEGSQGDDSSVAVAKKRTSSKSAAH